MTGLVNIGFGNLVNAQKIAVVVNPDAAPIKRLVQNAKEQQSVVDATQGRRTKSVIILETGQVVLSAVQPDTIAKRFSATRISEQELKGEEHEEERNSCCCFRFFRRWKGNADETSDRAVRSLCTVGFRDHQKPAGR